MIRHRSATRRVVAALSLTFAAATVVACGGGPSAVPVPGSTALPVGALAPVPEDGGSTALSVVVEPPAVEPSVAAPNAPRETDPTRIENAPRHRAKVLVGPARPSKLAPGTYACRIDAGYKFRPCTVRQEDGFTWVDMPGSLLGLSAVVYDDGASIVLDGTSADPRPFGCFSCQERCSADPSSCVCQELMPAASRECLLQPLTTKLTKSGATWRGSIRHVLYTNHYEGVGPDRHVASWDTSTSTYLVEIAPVSAFAPSPVNGKKNDRM